MKLTLSARDSAITLQGNTMKPNKNIETISFEILKKIIHKNLFNINIQIQIKQVYQISQFTEKHFTIKNIILKIILL